MLLFVLCLSQAVLYLFYDNKYHVFTKSIECVLIDSLVWEISFI